MGSRMATRLLAAGHELRAWDLIAAGARLAASPREAADCADLVLSMLRDDEASSAVWDMGKELGILRATASAILGETPVFSPAAKAAAASMNAQAFAPMFPIDLVAKDFGYVTAVARMASAAVPLSSTLHALFQEADQVGFGDHNITGIITHFERKWRE